MLVRERVVLVRMRVRAERNRVRVLVLVLVVLVVEMQMLMLERRMGMRVTMPGAHERENARKHERASGKVESAQALAEQWNRDQRSHERRGGEER